MRWVALCLISLLSHAVAAQEKNALYAEAGGSHVVYSIHYERMLARSGSGKTKLAINTGFSLLPLNLGRLANGNPVLNFSLAPTITTGGGKDRWVSHFHYNVLAYRKDGQYFTNQFITPQTGVRHFIKNGSMFYQLSFLVSIKISDEAYQKEMDRLCALGITPKDGMFMPALPWFAAGFGFRF